MTKKLTKALKIIGIVILSFFILLSVVPYLIPLPQDLPCKSKEDLMSPDGHFTEIMGKQMYYEDYGDQNAESTIILVHGFGASTFSFRHNIAALTSMDLRVIAVDLLGYGLSDKDYFSDYSHPAHAIRLKALMDKLNIEKAYFMGHSMGASVITHFASKYPNTAEALILAAPAVDTKSLEPNLDAARIGSKLLFYPPFRRIAQLALRGYFFPDNVDKILASAYYNTALITADINAGYADRVITGDWDLALLGSTRDYAKNTLDFNINDLNKEVLIIAGADDTWIPLSQVEYLHEQIVGSRLQVIPRSGHLVMEESPHEFNQIIQEFLP